MIQGFIRSLCTRYSIYFNKKYSRRGSLFEGPYKSAHIPNTRILLHLVTYLHKNHGNQSFSSLNLYLNTENCAWMSKFDFTNNAENEVLMPQSSYPSYAETYLYTEQEKELLAGVIIEKDAPLLERRILDKDLASKNKEVISIEPKKKPSQKKTQRRIPEYIGLSIAFLLLLTLGLRSISITTLQAESINQVSEDTTPQFLPVTSTQKSEDVLSASASAKALDPLSLIYSYTVIKKDAGTVVVYKERDINSGAITTAHAGDHFVAYPIDNDWYQVRFTDDSKGYILSKHIDIEHIDAK